VIRMTKADRLAMGLLRPINPYASILLGIFTFIWGLWLQMPWGSFDGARLFSMMDRLAPEWAWGTFAMAVGALNIYTITRKKKKLLARSHGLATWHWGLVSLMMWLGDWQNTGGLTYSFIAIYASYCFLNVKINNVKFDEEIRSIAVPKDTFTQ